MVTIDEQLRQMYLVAEKALLVREVASERELVRLGNDYYSINEGDFYDDLTEIAIEIQAEENIRLKQGGEYFYRDEIRDLAIDKLRREFKVEEENK